MIRKNDNEIISVSAILKEGLDFYKVHFKHLIILSFLYFIANNLNSIWVSVSSLFYNPELTNLHSILMVPIIVLSFYFSTRVTVGIYKTIEGRLNDKEYTVREAINKGKGRFWAFVGTSILLSLLYLVTIIMPLFIIIIVENVAIKAIGIIIICISMLYLMVHFQFSVLHSVLDQSSGSQALSFSKNLVAGYKIPIAKLFMVTSIPTLVLLANIFSAYGGEQFPINNEALQWFARGIAVFVPPYIHTVTILAYRKLRELKEI